MQVVGAKKRHFSRYIWLSSILLILLLSSAGYLTYVYFSRDLPKFIALKEYAPDTITRIYASNGELIDEFYVERRILVPLSQIPSHVIKAFLAAEDARFFEHQGVDYKGILRAFISDIKAGRIVQGGSTITQQVVKSLFLTPKKDISRKIKEAILAYRLERSLSKEDILYLYLNQIYLGHGAYGVQAASEVYFGKDVGELSLSEAALLAGLPKAPSRYSPYAHPDAAIKRRNYVINRMLEEGFISYDDAKKALDAPLVLKPKRLKTLGIAPYFTEYVKKYIEERYGSDALYRGGLKIYTTLDIDLQRYAHDAVVRGLKRYDKRHGYRGPIMHIDDDSGIEGFNKEMMKKIPSDGLEKGVIYRGVVVDNRVAEGYYIVRVGRIGGRLYYRDMRWAGMDPSSKKVSIQGLFKKGDVIEVVVKRRGNDDSDYTFSLEQTPDVQGALIVLEPKTGEVKAMVGGYDFNTSQFNRAVQAKRQPGSAFKPIIYAAAIDKGMTPADIIIDSPIVYEEVSKELEDGIVWKPKNFDEKFHGPITLREALAKSRNVVTIKLLRKIGISYVIDYARNLGIRSPLNPDLSLALGSSSLSPLELSSAYSVFASGGMMISPVFIKKVVDRDGNILEVANPSIERVISSETAYIMTSLLEGVVQNGTGWRAKALGRPAAGKTGTTNKYIDAWFVGYTADYLAGAWVGFDDQGSLGDMETGSRAALPIWLRFMKNAHKDKPIKNFSVPDGVVFAKIDPKTGKPAQLGDKDAIFEVFKKGTEPKGEAEEANFSQSGRFFDMDSGGDMPLLDENIDNGRGLNNQ